MPIGSRLTNPGRPLRNHYFGGDSDAVREIPPEFRAALDLTIIEIPLPWDQEIIPLSDTVLASKAEQKVTSEWMRRTTYKPIGPVTLLEYDTNKNKQVVTRTRNFKYLGDAIGAPGPFTDVQTKNLGNLHFVENIEDSGSVFANRTSTKSIIDVVPEIFRATIPVLELKATFTAPITIPQILGPGELYRSETEEDVFNISRTVKGRFGMTYPVVVTSYKMTPEQQVETITDRLALGSQALVPFPEMVEGTSQDLGDGSSWLHTGVVPSVFSNRVGETSIPDLIPPEFRANLPLQTHAFTITGTALIDPILGIGELSRKEEQLTVFNMRRTTTGRDTIDLPKVHSNKELTEEYGGAVCSRILTLDTFGSMAVDQGLMILTSKLTNLGNGLGFKETLRGDGTEWQELIGTEVDPRTGIVVEVRRKVVAAGTTGGVGVAGYVDVKPIDIWRSIQIASKLDLASLPLLRQWETTIEHSFPNTLNGLTWVWAAASGLLSYAFDSALVLDITQGYSGPCRALVSESYTDGPPPDVVVITQFFPQGHMIGYAWSMAAALSDECDACTDFTRADAKTWPVPPCLHAALTIGGGVTLSGGTITDTLPATVPTALPSSGTLITKAVDVEPWRFNIFYRKMVQIYVP